MNILEKSYSPLEHFSNCGVMNFSHETYYLANNDRKMNLSHTALKFPSNIQEQTGKTAYISTLLIILRMFSYFKIKKCL